MANKPKTRRYRPVVLALFEHGAVRLQCATAAQKRVKKMVILEKHVYEKEQNPLLSSKWKMKISATETSLEFRLVSRMTQDNFIAESLTPSKPAQFKFNCPVEVLHDC